MSAAPFRDRVVHHALCRVIEPIFERSFIHDSYANRTGKGTHRALDRAQEFARRFCYVLQVDVIQFFPAIDHAVLYDILARKLDDPDVLWLVDRVLASGVGVLSEAYDMTWFPADDLFAALYPRGLPIQDYLSLLARKGRLEAIKRGRNWYTTRRAVAAYRASVADETED